MADPPRRKSHAALLPPAFSSLIMQNQASVTARQSAPGFSLHVGHHLPQDRCRLARFRWRFCEVSSLLNRRYRRAEIVPACAVAACLRSIRGLNLVAPWGSLGVQSIGGVAAKAPAFPREDGMDCCGHVHGLCHGHALTRRQWMWSTVLTSVGAMLTGGGGPLGSTAAAQTAETASAALDVLRKSISVDVHTHGGTTGITSQAPPNDDLANGHAGRIVGGRVPRGRAGRSHSRQKCGRGARRVAHAGAGPALPVPS